MDEKSTDAASPDATGAASGDADNPAAHTADGLRTRIGEHAKDLARQRLPECRALVSAQPAITHLAHFRIGALDFSVDRLPRSGPSVEDVERAGRRLTFHLSKLGDELAALNTGPLVRLLVQSSTGAMVCDTIIPDHCLVATIEAPVEPEQPLCRQPEILALDLALSQVIDKFRTEIALASAQLGGTSGPSHVATSGLAPPLAEDDLPDLLRRTLDETSELHYVAVFRAATLITEVNGFDRPSAAVATAVSDPESIDSQARAARYQSLARRVPSMVHALGRVTRPVLGTMPARVVLDVERGAIYLYSLPDDHHLFAVTLDQRRVGVVEDAVAQLAVQASRQLRVKA